ncbi:LpxI family protein [Mycoplana ramosa]|uniref:LpxI family protein n=1 Tax=Mycoplana ramosa TaxID=40837 RepID=A0ABW3YR98_MYCRA
MASGRPESAKRLAIIAGSGLLPVHLARAARLHGEDPFVLTLANEADQDWSDFEHQHVGVGDYAALSAAFAREGIDRAVLSGAVQRRPEWREIRPTLRTLLQIPAVVRTLLNGGDDTVLKMVIRLIEANGVRIVGAHEIAPELLATEGVIGKILPNAEDLRDIAAASAAALALGALDVGQGAVAVGGRVVALEGAEGTDQMLERVADLRRQGRISQSRKGVLVKLCKPRQDTRADLPSIGVDTVHWAAAAGLAGIATETGRSLVLDRDRLIEAADRAGLFVSGIVPGKE